MVADGIGGFKLARPVVADMFGDRRTIVLGFAGALVVLGALVWFVGVADVVGAIAGARPALLAAMLVTAAVWLVAWGISLWAVLGAIGERIRIRTAISLYTGAIFSNNITPFGQAGGEPLSALLIADAADTEYETGLAAIASVDALHFVPTTVYATVGFVFVVAGTVKLGQDLVFGLVVIGVLMVVVPLVGYLGWRFRERVEAAIARTLVAITTPIARLLPKRTPVTYEATKRRVDSFFVAIERVATDRRTLLVALGFSAIGWLAQVTVLWLALIAVDASVPFTVVLLVVPIAAMAGLAPLPGGSGAVESALAALLVATATVSLTLATSAALLHRVAIYWLPTLVGGVVATMIGAERVR